MDVQTLPACPICTRNVTGNAELGFLCKHCKLVFSRRWIRGRARRTEQVMEFTEYVRSASGRTYHVYTCKYARRIKEPLTVGPEDTGGLRACRCVKVNA